MGRCGSDTSRRQSFFAGKVGVLLDPLQQIGACGPAEVMRRLNVLERVPRDGRISGTSHPASARAGASGGTASTSKDPSRREL